MSRHCDYPQTNNPQSLCSVCCFFVPSFSEYSKWAVVWLTQTNMIDTQIHFERSHLEEEHITAQGQSHYLHNVCLRHHKSSRQLALKMETDCFYHMAVLNSLRQLPTSEKFLLAACVLHVSLSVTRFPRRSSLYVFHADTPANPETLTSYSSISKLFPTCCFRIALVRAATGHSAGRLHIVWHLYWLCWYGQSRESRIEAAPQTP
jgi:hypothetical protein